MVEEFERRVGEVEKVVRKVLRAEFGWVKHLEWQELVAEGEYYVYKNAWRYDPEKSSFCTFVYITAKSGIARFIRSEREHTRPLVDITEYEEDFFVEDRYDEGESLNKVKLEAVIATWGGMKRKIAKELLKGRLQVDVAKDFGVTRQYVSVVFNKIREACNERYVLIDGLVCEKEGVEK